jgi:hypothetical protein
MFVHGQQGVWDLQRRLQQTADTTARYAASEMLIRNDKDVDKAIKDLETRFRFAHHAEDVAVERLIRSYVLADHAQVRLIWDEVFRAKDPESYVQTAAEVLISAAWHLSRIYLDMCEFDVERAVALAESRIPID